MQNSNIRTYFQKVFETHKRTPVLKEARITPYKLSLFLNNRGGMDIQTGIRMLIATNHKIIDASGNVVYGNPENREAEINDNILHAEEILGDDTNADTE